MSSIQTEILIIFFTIPFSSVKSYSPIIGIEDTVEFTHESCSREIHNSFEFKTFHEAKPFYTKEGTLELMVRFKGIADGHIALTVNSSATEPLYMIILGSYNNRYSEIRRTKQAQAKVKLSTPGVMSGKQWRGFVIKYNSQIGSLLVFPEGGEVPLLVWTDSDPLDISYYSFTAYRQRLLEVAYDCRPKDNYSSIPKTLALVNGGTPDPKLRKKLLLNYDAMAQPYPSLYKTKTTVTIPYLNVIHYDINDEAQTFEVHAWIVMSWEDERLNWANYSGYDRSGYLHFAKEEIWLPDIATYNTAKPKAMDDFADAAQILVQSNGTAIWVPPIRFITNCQMNLYNWPFDTQKCNVKIGSWTYHEDEIDLQFGSTSTPESRIRVMVYEGHQFPNNTQWVITEYSAARTAKKYSCCVEKYVDITYYFTLARKYSTFTYTLILPVLMISVMSVIGFLFPLTGNARVTIASLNFLIITSYMIYFRTRLPTIDHVPKIVKLFTWNLFVTTVNLAMTAFLTNLTSAKGNSKIPEWAKKVLDSKITKYLSLAPAPSSEPGNRGSAIAKARVYSVRKGENDNSMEDGIGDGGLKLKKNDWNNFIDVVDKISFVFFFSLTFIMVLAHLL